MRMRATSSRSIRRASAAWICRWSTGEFRAATPATSPLLHHGDTENTEVARSPAPPAQRWGAPCRLRRSPCLRGEYDLYTRVKSYDERQSDELKGHSVAA